MSDSDIKEIRSLIDDIRVKINDTSDKGIMGQWNTFQYVARSEDTRAWAEGSTIGKQLVARLNQNQENLKSFAESSLEFTKAIEEYIDTQQIINNG